MTFFGPISRPEWPLILLAYVGTLMLPALAVWLWLPDLAALVAHLARMVRSLLSRPANTARHAHELDDWGRP